MAWWIELAIGMTMGFYVTSSRIRYVINFGLAGVIHGVLWFIRKLESPVFAPIAHKFTETVKVQEEMKVWKYLWKKPEPEKKEEKVVTKEDFARWMADSPKTNTRVR